jgi:hypothetical protein
MTMTEQFLHLSELHVSTRVKESQDKECANPAIAGILQILNPEKHLREYLQAE